MKDWMRKEKGEEEEISAQRTGMDLTD